jgi:hypothetical protein
MEGEEKRLTSMLSYQYAFMVAVWVFVVGCVREEDYGGCGGNFEVRGRRFTSFSGLSSIQSFDKRVYHHNTDCTL